MRELFTFPNPVNEVSARLVATGVVALGVAFVITGSPWLLALLVYGFLARVAAGPRFSPLGLFVTRVLTPRLPLREIPVPGPPKRFAQGIGAVFSLTAAVLFVAGSPGAARVVVACLVGAASLEAFAGFCAGCSMFARLMRFGVIPETVCEACNDLSRPRPVS